MDIRKVKKLIEMLEASDLAEIEIQEGEESVRLVKNKTYSNPVNQQVYVPSAPENIIPSVSEIKEVPETSEHEPAGDEISSSMVGTFYSSASPGSKPFITEGDDVNEGDVVCIVEAMKMMNEIKSEFSGKVLSVNIENSEPVEYGQTLFVIGK